ncbi:MAG: hypothetical protein JW981_10690, partial [Anaerolineae bacterium]|nr:hypothetical protein [Anaerolineae bacterium]
MKDTYINTKQRELLNKILVTGIASFILIVFIMPLGYMFTTGLKNTAQMNDPTASPFWPQSPKTIEYEGEKLEVFQVPMPDGGVRELAA